MLITVYGHILLNAINILLTLTVYGSVLTSRPTGQKELTSSFKIIPTLFLQSDLCRLAIILTVVKCGKLLRDGHGIEMRYIRNICRILKNYFRNEPFCETERSWKIILRWPAN
jgi:hypothetical protein